MNPAAVDDSALVFLPDDARPCMVPPDPPEQPWERFARGGARILAAFLTLALALFAASVTIALSAHYGPRHAPAALEQVRGPR